MTSLIILGGKVIGTIFIVLAIILFIFAIIISIIFLKKTYFASICLTRAIKCKQEGVSKYNYLRYEMPNNDKRYVDTDFDSLVFADSLFADSPSDTGNRILTAEDND